jgi:hypothetical protein
MLLDVTGWRVLYCQNHKIEEICGCGKNAWCRACGYGYGQQPCDCVPMIEFGEEDASNGRLTD